MKICFLLIITVLIYTEQSKAEQNATELTELRNKLYFAYLFINILWMVISLAVKQANIKIALPQEISNQLPSQCYDEPLPANATDSVDREPFEMEPLRIVFKTTTFLKFKNFTSI